VDISEEAIAQANHNLEINHFVGQATLRVANAFDYLREAAAAGMHFDVIILDPPAFAKSKSALPGARRGYKEINLRAMRLLREGGFLVTASYSYAMNPEMFREVLLEAAVDAHKVLREVRWSGAAADHPEILGVPESHYLKFAILEMHTR
jgi:23S rRNA (cytosine1962-C5)-methyltransferase